jgi:hypothetical protein
MARKLNYEGSKLSDAVAEINRYNHRPILIDDPKLRDFETGRSCRTMLGRRVCEVRPVSALVLALAVMQRDWRDNAHSSKPVEGMRFSTMGTGTGATSGQTSGFG